MRAAQSGRSLTSFHADDGPFESCVNTQVLREEPVNTPMVELGGIEPPSIRR
jgi:hypothetical protein